jgi:hypothetical protein
MLPLGLVLVFGAYTLGLWAYCLLRGYNITLPQLFTSTSSWPAAGASSGAAAS